MISISILLAISLIVDIVSLCLISQSYSKWKTIDSSGWPTFSVQDKSSIQSTYSCCGFDGPDTAYVGNVTTASDVANPCSDPSFLASSSSCQVPVQQSLKKSFWIYFSWLFISVLFLSISIWAAHFAKLENYRFNVLVRHSTSSFSPYLFLKWF